MQKSRYGIAATVLIGLIAAGTLSACANQNEVQQASDTEQYTEICQDKDTGERVDDSNCNDTSRPNSHASWYYLPPSIFFIPSIGSRIDGGSYSRPSNNYPLRRNIPSGGLTVPRPSFDNSKMKPVPGDFQPPTAPATGSAGGSTLPTQKPVVPTAPAPAPAATQKPAVKAPEPVKVPAKVPAVKAPSAPKAPTTRK